LEMKTLRILILVLFIPAFVSAMLADATDQGGSAARTLQISSNADDLDLLCDKLKQTALSGILPQSAERASTCPCSFTDERAVRTIFQVLLPFALRAPPLA
jgi:hypothetical protein